MSKFLNSKLMARTSVISILGIMMATGALAGDAQFAGDTLMVKPSQTLSNASLSVTGPHGFYMQERSEYGTPSAALSKHGALADGVYNWEIRGATSALVPNSKFGLNNGRDAADQREFVNKSAVESGTFRVLGGVITKPSFEVEEAPKPGKLIKSHTGH